MEGIEKKTKFTNVCMYVCYDLLALVGDMFKPIISFPKDVSNNGTNRGNVCIQFGCTCY